jgi:hypothetical protein
MKENIIPIDWAIDYEKNEWVVNPMKDHFLIWMHPVRIRRRSDVADFLGVQTPIVGIGRFEMDAFNWVGTPGTA